MDEPLQILIDELQAQGKTWEETVEIIAGVENPWDQLDLADWLADHREVSQKEMVAESCRIIENRHRMEKEK